MKRHGHHAVFVYGALSTLLINRLRLPETSFIVFTNDDLDCYVTQKT